MRRALENSEITETEVVVTPRLRVIRLTVLCAILAGLGGGYAYYQQLPKIYEERTHSAENSEDWEQVEKWAQKWVSRDPQNGDAILALADAYKFQKKLVPLVDLMLEFPPTDQRFNTVMQMRGDLLLSEANNLPAAESNWLILLNQDPLNEYARQRLTFIYSMTLQREKLQYLLRESIFYDCEPPEAYFYLFSLSNLNFSNGLVKTTEWLKQTPDNRELLIAQAVFAARSSSGSKVDLFDEDVVAPGSKEELELLSKQYPDSVEIACYQLQRAVNQGDVDGVEQLIHQLDEVNTEDCRVFRFRGWLAKMNNDLDQAKSELEQGLKINPLDWKCHLELSQIERLLGNKDGSTFHADLAERGKVLERKFMELPSAVEAPYELMLELLQYIQDCGDQQVAARLSQLLR